MKVAFFGHRNTPHTVKPQLELLLKKLIGDGCDDFYVGNQGGFDRMVLTVLRELKKEYPQIRYAVVMAYLNRRDEWADEAETLFPDGLEQAPPRYAVDRRNRWMIRQVEIVVTYVQNPFGGAAKFQEVARKRGKQVINLYDSFENYDCKFKKSLVK